MHQIQQQLQHVQQMTANAISLSQQVIQDLQQISQTVQNATVFATQAGTQAGGASWNAPQWSGGYSASFGQQPGAGYSGGGYSASVSAVMGADRAYAQSNQPSYRNYNAQTPAYSSSQSIHYTSSVNPRSVQSVMAADRQSGVTQSYRGAFGAGAQAQTQTPAQAGGYGMAPQGAHPGVQAVMQADRAAQATY